YGFKIMLYIQRINCSFIIKVNVTIWTLQLGPKRLSDICIETICRSLGTSFIFEPDPLLQAEDGEKDIPSLENDNQTINNTQLQVSENDNSNNNRGIKLPMDI